MWAPTSGCCGPSQHCIWMLRCWKRCRWWSCGVVSTASWVVSYEHQQSLYYHWLFVLIILSTERLGTAMYQYHMSRCWRPRLLQLSRFVKWVQTWELVCNLNIWFVMLSWRCRCGWCPELRERRFLEQRKDYQHCASCPRPGHRWSWSWSRNEFCTINSTDIANFIYLLYPLFSLIQNPDTG